MEISRLDHTDLHTSWKYFPQATNVHTCLLQIRGGFSKRNLQMLVLMMSMNGG